jgi:hypothetical protein
MKHETLDQQPVKRSFSERYRAEIEGAVAVLSLVGILGVAATIENVDAIKHSVVDTVVNPIGRELFPIPGPSDLDNMLTSITVPTPYEA